jgi:phage N-6-adenine-methyltransferase
MMMRANKLEALHASSRDDWETPNALYSHYDRVLLFDLDVCATATTAKCARWYSKAQDGLSSPWDGRVWCNPPYGRDVGRWIKRALWAVQAAQTAPVACLLLPARTDTEWFHLLYGAPGVQIDFLRGRIRFVGAASTAPFPSIVATIRPSQHRAHGAKRTKTKEVRK